MRTLALHAHGFRFALEGERPREPKGGSSNAPKEKALKESGVARDTACRAHSKTARTSVSRQDPEKGAGILIVLSVSTS